MKSLTLTVVFITVFCLLLALSPRANAQCSALCSDGKKRCIHACYLNRSGGQQCIDRCYDGHAQCQSACSVSGRFLRRDEDLLEERYKSKFD